MAPSRGEIPVDARWQRDGDGAHYASARFRTRRARERDPRLVSRLLRGLPRDAPPIASVLDVPFGAGRLRTDDVLAAAARGGPEPSWTGVDVSHEMLAAAPREEARLVRADATALPFPDDTFDLVLCCRLLHHLPTPEERGKVLTELTRVARRYVVASYWDAASFQAWRRRTRTPLRRRGKAETRRAVDWSTLRAELRTHGARPVGRAHSLRLVSQQAFVLAQVEGAPDGPGLTSP